MTKAQARAWCRAQKKIIAAWAKEQRLRRLEALKQEVAAKKKRADEECKRKVAGAKAKPKPKKKARKAAPKKKVAKKRAAPRPRKKAPPRPRKKAAKPKARKRAPKRKAARKKASRKKATARGAPAGRVAERVRAAYAELRHERGLRNVLVHDLRLRSGVTRAQLHAFLNGERKKRRANATLGEPTVASRGQLEDALIVEGQPHVMVELFDVPEGIARRAPAPAGDAGRLAYAYFIERIREAVRSKGVKRFGEKVFIGSVWDRLRRSEPFKGMNRDEFNRLLVHAHQKGDLRMSRADLVSAMNRKDVDDSEIAHLNATFHFLNPDEVPVVQPVRARSAGNGFESAFRRAFDRLAKKARRGLVPLSELRGELPSYGIEQFNSELRRLRQSSDEYALEAFDGGIGGGGIPAAWNDGAIREGGRRYVFVKRRE